MAYKIQKLHVVICSECRRIVSDMLDTPPEEFTYCPKCGLPFEEGEYYLFLYRTDLPEGKRTTTIGKFKTQEDANKWVSEYWKDNDQTISR